MHLADSITTTGLTTTFTYDANGEVLTRTQTDTTTTTAPYATNGQSRTWRNTWSSSLLTSTTTPNNNSTILSYDASGALVSVTNALGQTTRIPSHSGGGLPQVMIDANGVVTALTYDARQRLLSRSVDTGAGTLTTSYIYYLNGDVTTTLPDGSFVTSLHDQAHRLIADADADGNQIDWVLDALGDATGHVLFDPSGAITFYRIATFDALGRQLTDTSTTTGESWRYTYDANGNRLTSEDPLRHMTTQVFDALNRLTASADANGGVVRTTYDAHNRPLTVEDKNGNTTTYVYDGFGEVIAEVSPDSGTTVYNYDSDGNRIRKVDAAGAVTSLTYDALDRVVTTTFSGDATQNVTYTYDQTGTPPTFGIGRLTGVKDAAGALTRAYDERGNLLSETRQSDATALTTAYLYDKASRVLAVTYPSGAVSSYTRDLAGRVVQMPFRAIGSDQAYSLFAVSHLPFGPVNSIHYNNGDNAAFMFDQDYRITKQVYASDTFAPYFEWAYRYDAADNVVSIKDRLSQTHSQAFGYDVLNRLTSARSAGTYGNLAWSYDKNGNVRSNQVGGTTYASNYTLGTNRLATVTWPGNQETFMYTPTGNIQAVTLNGRRELAVAYNQANRLAAVTGIPEAIALVTYDFRGRRFSKRNPDGTSTLYIYDRDGNLLEERSGGKVTDYLYLDGTNVAIWAPSEKHLYAIDFDRLGVPQLGRDEFGLTNWAAYSQPYGEMTITRSMGRFTGPVTENLRLPGQYFDRESGFHYNGARDYLPGLGRYLEADPLGLGGGLNPYLYAAANPQAATDRSGLDVRVYVQGLHEAVQIDTSHGVVSYGFGPGQGLASILATTGLPTEGEIDKNATGQGYGDVSNASLVSTSSLSIDEGDVLAGYLDALMLNAPMYSVPFYNCNQFACDIAHYPASSASCSSPLDTNLIQSVFDDMLDAFESLLDQ